MDSNLLGCAIDMLGDATFVSGFSYTWRWCKQNLQSWYQYKASSFRWYSDPMRERAAPATGVFSSLGMEVGWGLGLALSWFPLTIS